MGQFEFLISQGIIPKSPRFYQRVEGSPVAYSVVAGGPFAVRLRAGSSPSGSGQALRRPAQGRLFAPPEERLRSELAPELVEGMTPSTNEDAIRNSNCTTIERGLA